MALKPEVTAACGVPAEAQPVTSAADAITADTSVTANGIEAFTTM